MSEEYPQQFLPAMTGHHQTPVTMEDWALIRHFDIGLGGWTMARNVADAAIKKASVNSKAPLPNRPK